MLWFSLLVLFKCYKHCNDQISCNTLCRTLSSDRNAEVESYPSINSNHTRTRAINKQHTLWTLRSCKALARSRHSLTKPPSEARRPRPPPHNVHSLICAQTQARFRHKTDHHQSIVYNRTSNTLLHTRARFAFAYITEAQSHLSILYIP